ncbi:tyrosine-type recombinase/integrase [Inediibacterium massiliense]|uniref:tyrosine-type recombinase/integrase n=1 Tax=Inediibacterium massiliense TaxID=1658111 RepID=UPI0006B42FD4|nr:site-specific integrase [Inediibacterium massiliense]
MESKYAQLKIDGMHYVREVKDKGGDRGGYLLIDNNNKPVKEVYKYIKYRKKYNGDSINGLKRKVHDLCHFYNFMLFENIDYKLINYECMYKFISEYLIQIDPYIRKNDCIENSMITSISILEEYKNDKVKVMSKTKTRGLASESIRRIADNVKLYLIYLADILKADINLDDIYIAYATTKKGNEESMLNHIANKIEKVYSAKGIIKAAEIPYKANNYITPVEEECIFEKEEEKAFFNELSRSNPMYQLFFYLLSITGLRVSEALALKIYKVDRIRGSFDFNSLVSDVELVNETKCIWKIHIKVDLNNPKDLQIKNNKSRTIEIVDKTKKFESMLKQALIYRDLQEKRKKKVKENPFLFINRNGDRMKYPRTNQKFNEILSKSGLGNRKGRGQLVIHSFRHTFASYWIRIHRIKGMDVELDLLSRSLGHASISVTMKIYVHFFKEDREELLEKMNSLDRN